MKYLTDADREKLMETIRPLLVDQVDSDDIRRIEEVADQILADHLEDRPGRP